MSLRLRRRTTRARTAGARGLGLVAALCGVVGCRGSRTVTGAAAPTLVIRDVAVVDVRTGRVAGEQTIVIRGDRIVATRPSGAVRVPDGTPVVDGRRLVAVPGLWDMHVHVVTSPRAADVAPSLGLFLAHGVTGIREMGAPLDSLRALRADLRQAQALVPQMLAAGPLIDGPRHRWSQRAAVHVQGAADVPALVEALVARGVDFLKVYGNLPRDAYLALAADARRRQVDIAGHLPAGVTMTEAIGAGQRTFEHLGEDTFFECLPDGPRRLSQALGRWGREGYAAWYADRLAIRASRRSAECEAVIRRIARAEAWLTPTLGLELKDSSAMRASVLRFLSPSGRQACRGTVSSVLRVAPSIRDSLFAAFRRDVARLHAAGARLLAGTDVGNPCQVPGESLLRELELLVEAGLSPTAALRTATTNVGDMLRRPDVGHLGAGARADLVLVRENPLLDITRMRDVAGVVAGGRYLSPARLDALRAAATIP